MPANQQWTSKGDPTPNLIQSQLKMSVCRFVDAYAGEKAKLPDAAMVRRAGRYNDVLPA